MNVGSFRPAQRGPPPASSPKRWGFIAVLVLGAIWTLPNTPIGIVAGLVGMIAGARPTWRPLERALIFRHWPWGPGGAVTRGNAILSTVGLDLPCNTYEHRAGITDTPASAFALQRQSA
jgi:hypothetical protein